MRDKKEKMMRIIISSLYGWVGFMFLIYMIVNVNWFHTGDFNFRTAMAYHGILIPTWLILALSYLQHIEDLASILKLAGIGAVSASVFTGVGSAFIHKPGISFGTILQVTGMIMAEIIVLMIIIKSFQYFFKTSENNLNKSAWWTISIGMLSLSLATPLGHFAGAIKDFGNKFPLLLKHSNFLGVSPKDAVDGYIGSHSHQILAAFLAIGFALPLIKTTIKKSGAVKILEKTGLSLIILATVSQTVLYQYSAWFGWEPPDLFANGPNGLPLDDFILVILGIGMLLLIPSLFTKGKEKIALKDYSHSINRVLVIILTAYMIAIVILGLYIEFHEQFYGHGEGTALGVPYDMAYIRAHMIFGFMIIPILIAVLVNGKLIKNRERLYVLLWFTVITVLIGAIGTFVWTISLNPFFLIVSLRFTVALLLFISYAILKSKKSFENS